MDNRVSCALRENINKGANHRLRTCGKIPGVIYGLKSLTMNVEFGELDILHTLQRIGEHGVVDIENDGKVEKVIIKDVQRDPVTRKLMHIDMQRIDENKNIHVNIPIIIRGEKQLRGSDAVVQKQIDQIEVMGKPGDIPKFVAVDVSKLPPGRRITFNDIEIGSEISIVGDMGTIIAAITRIKDNVQNSDEAMLDNLIPVQAE